MRITLTKAQALEIQAAHIEHYAGIYGDKVRAIVAQATHADQLEDGIAYDVLEINRHIPRGGAIEMLLGVFQRPGD